jgi:hypothetical protein
MNARRILLTLVVLCLGACIRKRPSGTAPDSRDPEATRTSDTQTEDTDTVPHADFGFIPSTTPGTPDTPEPPRAVSPVRDSAIVEICHRRGERFSRCFNNRGEVRAGHISPMGRKQRPLLHVDDGPATADELLRIWRAASAIEPELLTRDDAHAKGATDSLEIRYRDGHRTRLVWRNGGDGGMPSPATQALVAAMAATRRGLW